MEDSSNVVHVIPNPVWATEEDYINSYDSSEPPSKKTKGNNNNNNNKSIGKMFFKTKLCCKFRAGTCPYVTNCNFAHSMEELRRPPHNWQEIVAATSETGEDELAAREEFQIPAVVGGFGAEAQRSYKGRHCKKFYTEEGCPYGDSCTFLHDEQSKNRESVAISLGPGGYGGNGGGGGGGGNGGSGVVVVVGGGNNGGVGGNGSNLKPSNWKTRICNKWELTGYCPFGSKCHFAHGSAELHRYGGGLVDLEGKDSPSAPSDSKAVGVVPSKSPIDAPITSVPHSDVYHHLGLPSQRSAATLTQRPGQRAHKWKGPDKISRIYGDWIDDME
ncbi:Zinc finger CCCH domain-containing protein 12 [Linum grandiflorum]